jgi:hypothetical protein
LWRAEDLAAHAVEEKLRVEDCAPARMRGGLRTSPPALLVEDRAARAAELKLRVEDCAARTVREDAWRAEDLAARTVEEKLWVEDRATCAARETCGGLRTAPHALRYGWNCHNMGILLSENYCSRIVARRI